MRFLLLSCFLSVTLTITAQSSFKEALRSSQNYAEIVRQGEDYFATKHPGKTKADLTEGIHRDGEFVKFMRWQSFWSERLNPDGTLGDISAFHRKQRPIAPSEKAANPYSDVPWTNINYTGYITDQIGLGRTTSVGFHPTDVNTFYVGAAIGGLWKTTDGGQNYIPLGDDLPFMAVSAIIVDKANPNTLYIAISDHVWYGPQGIGVYKSTDAGVTWAPTSLTFSFTDDVRIYWLEADPTNPGTIYAATANGLYKTTDGFTTHTQLLTDNCFNVRLRPGNPRTVYVGTNDGRFLRSTNNGITFIATRDFGNGSVYLAVTPLDDQKVYARNSDNLFRSTNRGTTFASPETFPEGGQVFTFAPTSDEIILSGNFETHRSENGGEDFTATSQWRGNNGLPQIHVDQRNMFLNPLEPDAVYYCNDGGLYRYNISTDVFDNLSDGLAITQYYDIAVSQTDANVVGGGSQDNGNVFRDENGNWRQYAPTGDGMNQEIDQTDAGTRYWAYQFGSLHRWKNGGNQYIKPPAVNYDGAWETPFKLDPSNADRLIVGYRRVYESLNEGITWTTISGELAGGANLNELAIAPSNGERVYATRGAILYVKNTNNDAWVTRNLPGSISDIEVDPLDMNKVYVSVPGFSNGNKVYVSEDAGATWGNITGSLPNVSVGALELYHDAPGGVFVGTDAGVYYRDDQVADWLEYGSLPHTRVEDVEIQYAAGLIRVGTHGRGVLEAAVQIEVCNANSPDEDEDGTCDTFDACPNFDNTLIDTPCDDGDPFSDGETFDAACGCSGGQANLNYCAAEGSAGTGSDYIASVSLNGVDNGSGQSNYSDFRNVIIPVNIGETYTLSASFNFAFDIDRFHAWVDWDRDGTFEETEYIGMTIPANNTSTGQLTVPVSTLEGATTMRVRGVFSTDHVDPCGSAFGEVEDYTLSVRCVANCSLPVDWTSFNARSVGKQTALLQWETANEQNLQQFRVERSANGRDFALTEMVAAGNTPEGRYELVDEDVQDLVAYYRIGAEDLDGTLSYSPIRQVTWSAQNERDAILYPNPVANGQLHVAWAMPAAGQVTWLLYNAWGQEVRRGHLGANAGANKVDLAVEDLPAGVYLLRLRTKDWDWTEEFIRR